MSQNIIKSICWDITSKCNECCGFCYRNQNIKELDLNSNKFILKKLIDFGVDKISFVGGEPLLYKDLFELVEWGRTYAKEKTVFSITTNGILLTDIIDNQIIINTKLIEQLLQLFDWITFSLDGSNSKIQNKMGRNSLHFDRIISILEYLSQNGYPNKIKINTVVSKINANCIVDLYKLLCKYNVKRWKIFRFLPSRGNALEYKDKYYISEDTFIRIINEIDKQNTQIRITINGHDNFDNSYITISSEGNLVIFNNDIYVNKVNLLHEDISNILKYIDVNGHQRKRSDFLHC